ncbi:MAG: tyrosine-type recombinase/integrase [Cyanobacteria bacterium]|nr:tyrosine-type recombinase/integrase [Cyanobacteriota bacterium]
MIFNYASSKYENADGHSILPDNPVKRLSQIRAWNKIHRRQDVIQPHDLKAWFDAVDALENRVFRDYFLFCLFTGLRRSEAMNLKWSHLDLKARVVTVPAEITKSHSTHQLPLTDFLLNLLERRGRVRLLDNDYIFPGDNGNGHIVEPKRAIASVRSKSGVKWSMHTLRRTFETTAESLDLSYYALKRLLNHKISGDVTSGYIITSTERLRQPMERISEFFKERMEIQDLETAAGKLKNVE